MLSRDPVWMFPLIKYLLKIKTKTPSSNSDHLKVINERISKAIMGNRVHTRSSYDICSYTYTCMWWKTTNNICTHKSSSRCTLSKEEIRDLNCFFGQLCVCTDNDYQQPEPVPIPTDAEAPCMLKRTAGTCMEIACEPEKDCHRIRSDTFLDMERPCWNSCSSSNQDLEPVP